MEKGSSIVPSSNSDLLAALLKDVSRSFYKTLHILPAPVRPQISLAYLLARTSDTIADSGRVQVEARLLALRQFRERFSGKASVPLDFSALYGTQTSKSEEALLRRVEEGIAVLNSFTASDRALIIHVLDIITAGQEQDLLRFESAPGQIHTLQTAAELDEYTYKVAGCVGEFWTRICVDHLFRKDRLDQEKLIHQGIRFGKGLQLVNILRDLPSDLRQGRCYMPADELARHRLTPQDLLSHTSMDKFRPLYTRWLTQARDHLHIGWQYTTSLPWRHVRVRLACAWPLLIGFETLNLLERSNVLDSASRIKVSRPWIKRMVVKSAVCYPFPGVWRKLG